jgi:hypothetical protein
LLAANSGVLVKLAGIGIGILIMGFMLGFIVAPKDNSSTVTQTSTATQSVTSTQTTYSIATVTFPQATTAIIVPGKNFTQTQTNTLTQTSTQFTVYTQTATVTSISTQTQTTVIIYSQTATTQPTINGQISSTATLQGTGAIYPGQNVTINVSVSNGVGQILNMTFSPYVQTSSQPNSMTFYPSTFSRIVPMGSSTFSFFALVKTYSSRAPSADYQVQIPESYILNGNSGSITAYVDVPITNPLTISSWSLSGPITGSCSFRANPNSIGDYNCGLIGNPNQTGTITWQGNSQGQQSCAIWTVISPVIQVFVNNAQIYNQCSANGQGGFVIGPGAWTISFTLGIPSGASNQNNNVEFVWG